MIDAQGYRANVGAVIVNDKRQILLTKRYQQDAWQLPQGGIDFGETAVQAMFRELNEEVGLLPQHVKIIAKTPKWLRYDLPEQHIRRSQLPTCVGQKQVWFLFQLIGGEENIKLDNHSEVEFDDWTWVDYWHPIEAVIDFKKNIYEDMLKALAPIAFNNQHKVPKHLHRSLKCSAILV